MGNIPRYKNYGGKRYEAKGTYHKTKSLATASAKRFREDGLLVRTVKFGDRYVNYTTYSRKRIKSANVQRKKHGLPVYKRNPYKSGKQYPNPFKKKVNPFKSKKKVNPYKK